MKNTQMHICSEAFSYATIAGLWPRVLWKSKRTRLCYDLYALLNILVMATLFISEFGEIYLTTNVHELIDSLHLFLSVSNACLKCANILLRRASFVKLTNMFFDEKCMPINSEEKKIRQHFDWQSRVVTISICILGELAAFSYAMKPLFFICEKYTLAARAWLPYDINSSLTFWPSFLHQALASHVIAAWNVANDVLAIGFMLQICSQLRLISHRLKNLSEIMRTTEWMNEKSARQFEGNFVKQCALHHLHVIEIIKNFKLAFAPNILSQYCLSGFTICLTMYELIINKQDISTLIIVAIYLISMAIELGVYCWFGNEVTLKSMQINDFIYEGDWFHLHPRTVKCLTIIMLRASSPIFVTCGPLVTLSNAAYMSILKKSYSAYNVLQKMH